MVGLMWRGNSATTMPTFVDNKLDSDAMEAGKYYTMRLQITLAHPHFPSISETRDF